MNEKLLEAASDLRTAYQQILTLDAKLTQAKAAVGSLESDRQELNTKLEQCKATLFLAAVHEDKR